MAIGELQPYTLELKPGEEITNHGRGRLANGREIIIKSILDVKVAKDGKIIVKGNGRLMPLLEEIGRK